MKLLKEWLKYPNDTILGIIFEEQISLTDRADPRLEYTFSSLILIYTVHNR